MKGHTYLWRNEDDGKQATALLRKQHAAFVQLVKGLPRILCATTRGGLYETVVLDDLLAALQQGGKK